jgi:hypothetical protein
VESLSAVVAIGYYGEVCSLHRINDKKLIIDPPEEEL